MKNNPPIRILSVVLLMLLVIPALTTEIFAQQSRAKTVNKQNPVPKNWRYIYDSKKGYGFYVPAGSSLESNTYNKIDVAVISTPEDIDIFVLAYKDRTLTKEDLLDDAVAFLEELGQKVTPGKLRAESEDYAVADATTVHPELGNGKLRILVGTDITDNYIMIIGASVKNFAANEKTIDTIWGSFEMWSGGASGKN